MEPPGKAFRAATRLLQLNRSGAANISRRPILVKGRARVRGLIREPGERFGQNLT